ncbi:hypothetical protein CFBP2533_06560 [Xanthomonas hortorum pv. pelargonii]|uniref:Uncharacterized protein n=1 Tax=Xanthomonas hortorum pv. pelargonii TaxID=453602 RepID=A0A6V7BUG1_9XANT|nr:hypothetical protein CFBP2533_06560 [Xanthomonas hortorum pv. pelargonii]CAD0305768.1 hypothetical protein CFBP2533_06560 [Xanthomonas hortorum pv. pelargonii]
MTGVAFHCNDACERCTAPPPLSDGPPTVRRKRLPSDARTVMTSVSTR